MIMTSSICWVLQQGEDLTLQMPVPSSLLPSSVFMQCTV